MLRFLIISVAFTWTVQTLADQAVKVVEVHKTERIPAKRIVFPWNSDAETCARQVIAEILKDSRFYNDLTVNEVTMETAIPEGFVAFKASGGSGEAFDGKVYISFVQQIHYGRSSGRTNTKTVENFCSNSISCEGFGPGSPAVFELYDSNAPVKTTLWAQLMGKTRIPLSVKRDICTPGYVYEPMFEYH